MLDGIFIKKQRALLGSERKTGINRVSHSLSLANSFSKQSSSFQDVSAMIYGIMGVLNFCPLPVDLFICYWKVTLTILVSGILNVLVSLFARGIELMKNIYICVHVYEIY